MEAKTVTADTKNLIALCHIIDDFGEFQKKLEGFIKTKYNRDDIAKLYDISIGKFVLGSGRVKSFYQENKKVIDTINKHSTIMLFINMHYDFQGNLVEESNINTFYQYFLSHRGELDKIISTLLKIKELGIGEVSFNESIDFTKETYAVGSYFNVNDRIKYLDNMEAIPTYDTSVLKYRTSFSNYEIVLDPFPFRDDFSVDRRITVNSLLFDPSRLPVSISKETIFDRIRGLKRIKEDEFTAVKTSVDLKMDIDSLILYVDSLFGTLEKVEDENIKAKLIGELKRISASISTLEELSIDYDESVVERSKELTKEKLYKEKMKRLENIRNYSIFD